MSDKYKNNQSNEILREDEPTTHRAPLSDLASLTSPVNTQAMMEQIDAQIKESEQVISQSLASTYTLLNQAANHLSQAAQQSSQPASQKKQEAPNATVQHALQSDLGKQYQDALQSMQTADHQVATAITSNTNQTGVQHAMNTATQSIQQAEDMIHKGIQTYDSAVVHAVHQRQQTVTQLNADSEKTVAEAVSSTAQKPLDEGEQSTS